MRKKMALYAALVCMIMTGCSLKSTVSESVPEETSRTPEETEEISRTPEETEEISRTPEETAVPPIIESFPHEAENPQVRPPKQKPEGGCRLLLASDIHYLAGDLTDFGDGFAYKAEHGDGKVINYVWEITDAFIEAVKKEAPDLVILSGDLTLNGERDSHLEFAEKLREIEDAGIPVIVIPGNHDINNTAAAQFTGAKALGAAHIGPGDFADIYQDFGYREAVSRDCESLSYVYQIDDYNRALMLDTCQYEPYNQVGGMIKEETYGWIEEQMEAAWDLGMNVIPVGHHNLLDESEVYVEDCTIEHSEQLTDQLDSWDVPLFLSGHLHVQHFMRESGGYGIYEIVTSSLVTPPCQYGMLDYGDDGSFKYHTEQLDMEAWARETGSRDKNILNFKTYSTEFLNKVFYNQAQDEFERMDNLSGLTKRQKNSMAEVYAQINSACYAGRVVEVKEKETEKTGYRLWKEYGYPSILGQYLESVVRDGTKDYNLLEVD